MSGKNETGERAYRTTKESTAACCRFSKDLKVALVGPLPPPSGGMATQTAQLRRLLEGDGVSVELIQTNKPYASGPAGRIKGLRAGLRLVPYLVSLWKGAGRADLLHIMANSGWSWHLFAAPAVWIATFRKVPVVVNYRGGEAESFFRRSFRWVAPSLKQCAVIAVPSAFLEHVFGQWDVPVSVVPNIIDLERFSVEPGSRAATERDSVHLVVTRNLEQIYDVGTAIEAFALLQEKVPGAHLSVAGEGEEKGHLQALCERLGIQETVVFTGRLGHEEISDLYRSADILLNPSLADNMPNSLLEAMASGVPVVSTDVGGIPYLVENENSALLVPPGHPVEMAEAAERIIRDESLRTRLVGAGRKLVEQYRWENVAGKWSNVYDALVDR